MSKTIQMGFNRVEGDLEVKATIDNGVVTDAWMIGTMYRGIERMMTGRGSLDGLVITPRVCGICSTSHLLAAARALENLSGAAVAHNGRLIRHLVLAVEKLQSDVRHVFLMFAVDLANEKYSDQPLYAEAVKRFQPFSGTSVIEVIQASRKLPEIIAILGGQWPHSSFVVPGGITSEPSESDLRQCLMLLKEFYRWYENRVLGCSVERWQQVSTPAQLDSWLEESDSHRNGDLGFLIRCCREYGLTTMGQGHGSFLAVPEHGSLGIKSAGAVSGGFISNEQNTGFAEEQVSEQLRYCHYNESVKDGHPLENGAPPRFIDDSEKYSWAKAPRYNGQPAETGPLAELMVNGDPLFQALVEEQGSSVLVRELARITRPARLLPLMEQWCGDVDMKAPFYQSAGEIVEGEGGGLVQAPRGFLGHWLQLSGGRIEHYQIISPTTWNGSPRDDQSVRGPIEEALIGTPVADPDNPVEIGHVVRSFDLCMVCSVHSVSKNGHTLSRLRLGA
ncbi:MAG: nickel-dependent hydrogenase large subunit [Thermodesulfobacteriota bacterium]